MNTEKANKCVVGAVTFKNKQLITRKKEHSINNKCDLMLYSCFIYMLFGFGIPSESNGRGIGIGISWVGNCSKS